MQNYGNVLRVVPPAIVNQAVTHAQGAVPANRTAEALEALATAARKALTD